MRNRFLYAWPPIQNPDAFPGPEFKRLLESKFNISR